MIAPVINELAKAYKGRVVFGKLNVDENMMTARNYRITAIPLLLVFKNGALIDKLVGAYPKPMLERKIGGYL
jgi:thioredoxin 1